MSQRGHHLVLVWTLGVGVSSACAPTPQAPPAAPASGLSRSKATPAEAHKRMARAIEAAKAGDLDTTRSECRAALTADPKLEKAYLLLGSTCALEDDEACEAQTYQTAVAALPRSSALRRELGFLYLRQNKIEAGITELKNALVLPASDKPQILADLAFAYMRTGDTATAQQKAEEALNLAPACMICHLILGEIAFQSGDFPLAESAFAQAAALEPKNIKAQQNQAKAVYLQGDINRAVELFARVATLAPNNPKVRFQTAQVLLESGQPSLALPHLEAVVRMMPHDPRVLDLLAKAQRAAGHPKAARITEKRAAKLETQAATQPTHH